MAGTGEQGYSGDGGRATLAQFREPNDCFLDGRGGLLIADVQDQRIRRLNISSGVIATYAGSGAKERSGDGRSALEASIPRGAGCVHDGAGNTYIAEREGNGIRMVDTRGVMHTIAGTGEFGYDGDGGPALEATWGGPKAIRCDHNGNLLVVDTENHAIRRIDTETGIVTTIAGGRLGGGGRRTPGPPLPPWTGPTVWRWTPPATPSLPTATTTGCGWSALDFGRLWTGSPPLVRPERRAAAQGSPGPRVSLWQVS